VVDVSSATEAECSNGGHIIEIGVGDDTEEVIVCNGEDGEDAPESESIGRIEASLFCNGLLAGTDGLAAENNAVVFTDGSIWARASVTDGIIEVGDSAFYSREQVGAARAEVIFFLDVQPPTVGGFWVVGIDPASLDSVVEYFDEDLAAGSLLWTQAAEDCVVNRY
jgi:hypothetical protein